MKREKYLRLQLLIILGIVVLSLNNSVPIKLNFLFLCYLSSLPQPKQPPEMVTEISVVIYDVNINFSS